MILTDAHTHIYGHYNLDVAILSAFQNFMKASAHAEEPIKAAVLFLTESQGNDYYRILEQQAGKTHNSISADSSWLVRKTCEQSSLRIEHHLYPEVELFAVAGRQVVTEENLEVLALDCRDYSPSRASLEQTVTNIINRGGITVLPWGVGKWTGKRGAALDRFLKKSPPASIFLGDNGSRPAFWSSSLLDSANTNGFRVLSGSDPLPIAGEEKRICSFGSFIHAEIDSKKPAESVKNKLSDPATILSQFGTLQPLFSFVRQQVSIRLSSS